MAGKRGAPRSGKSAAVRSRSRKLPGRSVVDGRKEPTAAPPDCVVVGVGAMPDDAATLASILPEPAAGTSLMAVVVPYDPEDAPEPCFRAPPGMKLRDARPGVLLEPNHLYVAAREDRLVVKSGRFVAAGKSAARSPLDAMLDSLARDAGSRAMAVMLSGSAREGIDGLRAIKACGGTTIAQDPGSAVFDDAPRAAIASGLIDAVLAPSAIARELARAASRPQVKSAASDEHAAEIDLELGDVADEPLRRILSLLKSRFHVDLSQYKLTTVRRRIERRMSMSRFESLKTYAERLRSDPEALRALHDDLFIHVTQFFRDPESFDALRTQVFPALLKAHRDETPIRVWVPGCSTGEEAYSLAIALTEYLEDQGSTPKVQIFATDISDAAISHARRAVYPDSVRGEVGRERIERFFEPVPGGFKVRKEVRDLCIISRHDVTNNPPFANLDLVSCRNVLIYFGQTLQKRIVPIFHYALRTAGFLWLGRSETAGASSSLFSLVDKQNRIYSKIASPTPYLQISASRFTTENLELPKRLLTDGVGGKDLHKSADQLVLHKYGPPGVVITHELEILQYRGRTSPYLEPAVGQPSHSVLKMAHPDLLPALRPLIQSARKQNTAVRKENVPLHHGSSRRAVNIEVAPLNPVAPEAERQYLVLFEEHAGRHAAAEPPSPAPTRRGRVAARAKSKDQYVEQLQQEVDSLREYQQGLAEQFESSQEELTSANEELQATNEEFQSTNEELETAKEELQSANEELTTMNDELQSRNAELVDVNEKLRRGEDRFRLMVESVKDYAIYMLDPEGRVTSWNEGARRLKGYETSEILGEYYGRFFLPEDVAAGAPAAELERARVDGRFETEAWRLRKDGSRFWANVVVTRINDTSGALIGYSKVTRDLTERKRAEEDRERRERLFRTMISSVRDYAIFTLDPEARVSSWNEGARRLKGYEESEILGRHISVFYPPEDAAAGKVKRLLTTALAEGRVEDEGWRVRKDGTRFWADVVITPVHDAGGTLLGFTKVTRDLSERRKIDEALRAANEALEGRVRQRTVELERALKVRDDFLSIASHELKTPLTALSLQLESLQRAVIRGDDLVRAAKKVEMATRQTDRLAILVEALLDVSRLGSTRIQLELETFPLAEVVRDVVDRLATVAERAGSAISIVDHASNSKGTWDRSRLDQVLMNLMSNAIKYGSGRPVEITLRDTADEVELEVHDEGIGIPPEHQERIFGRFERAVSVAHYGGLGLGLYIARQIVDAHGGTVRVQSAPGEGSTFLVRLPRFTQVKATSQPMGGQKKP